MASAPPPGEGPAKPPSGSGGVPWRQGPGGWEYQGPDGQWHGYQPPPAPVVSQGAAPPPSPPPPPVGPQGATPLPPQAQAKGHRKWPWVVGTAAVLALVIGIAAGSGSPKHHGTSPSTSTSTSTNTTFSTTTGSTTTGVSTSTSSTASSLATLPPATTTTTKPPCTSGQAIPYNELARDPASLDGTCVTYRAKVYQYTSRTGLKFMLVDVARDTIGIWDTIVAVTITPTSLAANVYQTYIIYVSGTVIGAYSYTTAIGGTNTVPELAATQMTVVGTGKNT